jgi:hypothetical protein
MIPRGLRQTVSNVTVIVELGLIATHDDSRGEQN